MAEDFLSKVSRHKMYQLKIEIAELKAALAEPKYEGQKEQIKKSIREKEMYYNILADRVKVKSNY